MSICTLIVYLLISLESTDRDKGNHQHTRRGKEQHSNLLQTRLRV